MGGAIDMVGQTSMIDGIYSNALLLCGVGWVVKLT